MKKHIRLLVMLVAMALLASCSSAPKIVNELPSGGLDSDARVGIIWLSRCSSSAGCKKSSTAATLGEFTPAGSVGLLTYGAILSAHEDIIAALDTVDATELVEPHYLEAASRKFKDLGISATVVEKPFYPGSLDKIKRHKTIKASTILQTNKVRESAARNPYVFEQTYDFTDIAKTMDVDHLLVLDLLNFNVHREFFTLGVPISAPYAVGAVRLYLLDVENDKLLLNDYAYHEIHVVDGEWKQPDSWANLLKATNESLEWSIEDVMSRLAMALRK